MKNQEDFNGARKKSQADVETEKARAADMEGKLTNLAKQYDQKSETLNKMTAETFDAPLGEVRWVNQHTGTAWINLGRADSLIRQVSFSVYPADITNLTTSVKKASIEVTQFLGDHLAEARVTDDKPDDPIMPGDKIYTPIWSPNQPKHFALTGLLDVEGDGQSDLSTVMNLITMNGGLVDCYLNDKGEVIGHMTINTRYLVCGKNFDESGTEADCEKAYGAMTNTAAKLGIPSIPLQELLERTGWKNPTPVVRYGKDLNLKDFAPKATGPQKKSTGHVFVPRQPSRARKLRALIAPGCAMSASPSTAKVLEREFLTIRARLLDLAAALDRIERTERTAADHARFEAIRRSLEVLASDGPGRAERRPTAVLAPLRGEVAVNVALVTAAAPSTPTADPQLLTPWPLIPRPAMYFIDPHIHIASRTTDDLAAMARAGCVAVGEPAFWMGYDRSGAGSFYDYFRQLTEWEPKRTANYGIRHYAWVGINAKEAENVAFAREVIALLPEFLDRPDVLGIGEIGLNKCTKNEVATLLELIDLGMQRDEQLLFHTPHLEDKYKGTRMILDLLRADRRVDRSRVCIDHCEEHTIRLVLDEGYWAGITLYPTTKATPRAGRRHGGNLRPRADPGQFVGRLGAVRSAGRAGIHVRHAAPRPPRVAHSPDRLRESAAILQPEPQLHLPMPGAWMTRHRIRHTPCAARRKQRHTECAGYSLPDASNYSGEMASVIVALATGSVRSMPRRTGICPPGKSSRISSALIRGLPPVAVISTRTASGTCPPAAGQPQAPSTARR